ncbi:hypothetical protein [Parerythrobacter aestuarii]|uniref:hypothetical protein n=1 Tax=Parerythrobacter aestuarii TaxID=3020909 RepID=UPI0024DEC584|nr:hypothetical protein [Parerythrobacter aestuarii]
MATLEIGNKDAHDAYENKDHLDLIDAGLTANNLPQKAPDVTVSITDGGKRATVTYKMALTLVASDEDELEDVENLITGLLQDAAAEGLNTSGIPSNPLTIIKLTMSTIKRIRDIWETEHRIARLAVRDLPVKIKDRNGKTIKLRTKIFVDASWMANDPTEWGSYAWIELEMHRVLGIPGQHKGILPEDLDDLARTDGIIPWQPANGDDLVGTFYSDLHSCEQDIDRDEIKVTADVSCNAISDDDVVALVIRSMTIELEILEEEDKGSGIGESGSGTAVEEEETEETDEQEEEEEAGEKGSSKQPPTKKAPAKKAGAKKGRGRMLSELGKRKFEKKLRTDR